MEAIILAFIIIFFIVDLFLYHLTPFEFREQFNPFWRRIIYGSGIWMYFIYHIRKKK